MYIINKDFFVEKYYVANLDEINSSALVELERVSYDKIQDFLIELLGVDDFAEMNTFITSGVVSSTLPDKWNRFFNGHTYTNSDNVKVKWNGLIHSKGAFKFSMLTPLVCAEYYKNKVSSQTGTGEKEIESVLGTSANVSQKLVECWNDFLRMYQGETSINSIWRNFNFINGVPFFDYMYNNDSLKQVTLLQFLDDFKADFANVNKIYFDFKNQFGI